MRVINQRRYDDRFKEGALALLARGDRTMNAVARDLGIDWATLRSWYNQAEMAKKRNFPLPRSRPRLPR